MTFVVGYDICRGNVVTFVVGCDICRGLLRHLSVAVAFSGIVTFVGTTIECCFTSLSAQPCRYRDRRSPKPGLCPISF